MYAVWIDKNNLHAILSNFDNFQVYAEEFKKLSSASHNLDPELIEIQKVAKDFARQEMYPHMEKWDKEVDQFDYFLTAFFQFLFTHFLNHPVKR